MVVDKHFFIAEHKQNLKSCQRGRSVNMDGVSNQALKNLDSELLPHLLVRFTEVRQSDVVLGSWRTPFDGTGMQLWFLVFVTSTGNL